MLDDVIGGRGAKDFSDEMGHLIEQLRILGYKELRPWNDFFQSFKPPQWNWKHLEQRIITNFLHYRSNYLLISGIVMAIQLLVCPFEILSFLLVLLFDVYMILVMKRQIKMGDIIITEQQKRIAVGIISAMVLILSGALTAITWSIIYCAGINGLHMVFRPRSVTSKANKMYEEIKLSGYNNWFGGSSELQSTSSSANVTDSSDLENSSYGRSDSSNMRKRTGGNAPILTRPTSVVNGSRKAE
jgi:hypothetical protein